MTNAHLLCFCIILGCLPKLCIGITSFNNVLTPACESDETECHFELTFKYMVTMVYVDDAAGIGRVVVERDGKLYKRIPSSADCGTIEELTAEESEKVIYVDGSHRVVYGINDQFPGPAIVAYEGTELIIKVVNSLRNELVTIHWHGETMDETPWMDGVQDMNQCGIRPEEDFTYRFTPTRPGTYWYHAHVGEVRQEGLFGALIILEKEPDITHVNHLSKVVPDGVDSNVAGEFVLQIQDFYERTSQIMMVEKDLLIIGLEEYNNLEECSSRTKVSSGATSHPDIFRSGLINGRGQLYEDGSDEPSVHIPMEVLHVESNKVYRIRVIHTGVGFGFKLTIPQHQLHVVAMDGQNIIPVLADSLIVHPGERLDAFIITSNAPADYSIIFETLERYNSQWEAISPNYVYGSLLYAEYVPSDDDEDEDGSSPLCGIEDQGPCSIFNCATEQDGTNICLTLNDAKSTPAAQVKIPPPVMPSEPEDFVEHFLEFNVQRFGSVASINNKRFVWPTSPPQITDKSFDEVTTACSNANYDMESCTHTLKVDLHSSVQIVLTNIVANFNPTSSRWMDHPIHFHGYTFTVLKVGFPTYSDDGTVLEQNPDIKCLDDACLVTGWSDESWKGGNVPGIINEESSLKDTIMVPVGGYIVIRITADNPGYWLIHCHTEKHMSSGMAMILQVGEDDDMVPPPPGMPKDCGDFEWDGSFDYVKKYKKRKNKKEKKKENKKEKKESESMALDVAPSGTTTTQLLHGNILTIVAVSAANVLIVAIVLTVVYQIKKRKNKGYTRIDGAYSKNSQLLKP